MDEPSNETNNMSSGDVSESSSNELAFSGLVKTEGKAKGPMVKIVVILSAFICFVIIYFSVSSAGLHHPEHLPKTTVFNMEVGDIQSAITKISSVEYMQDAKKEEDLLRKILGASLLDSNQVFSTKEEVLAIANNIKSFSLSLVMANVKRNLVEGGLKAKDKKKVRRNYYDRGSATSYQDSLKEINPVTFEPVILFICKGDGKVVKDLLIEKLKLEKSELLKGHDAYMDAKAKRRLGYSKNNSEYYYDGKEALIVFDKNKIYFASAGMLRFLYKEVEGGKTFTEVVNQYSLASSAGDLSISVDLSGMLKSYELAFKKSGLTTSSKVYGDQRWGGPLASYQKKNAWLPIKEGLSKNVNMPEILAYIESVEKSLFKPIVANLKIDEGTRAELFFEVPEEMTKMVKDDTVLSVDFSPLLQVFPESFKEVFAINFKANKSLQKRMDDLLARVDKSFSERQKREFDGYKNGAFLLMGMFGISLDDISQMFNLQIAVGFNVSPALYDPRSLQARRGGPSDLLIKGSRGFILALGVNDKEKVKSFLEKLTGSLATKGFIGTPVNNKGSYEYVNIPVKIPFGSLPVDPVVCYALRDDVLIITISAGAIESAIQSMSGEKKSVLDLEGFQKARKSIHSENSFFLAVELKNVLGWIGVLDRDPRSALKFSNFNLAPKGKEVWSILAGDCDGKKASVQSSNIIGPILLILFNQLKKEFKVEDFKDDDGESRMGHFERAAIGYAKTISSDQATYHADNDIYGTIHELAASMKVDVTKPREGYVAKDLFAPTSELFAVMFSPVEFGKTGSKHFIITSAGSIRVVNTEKHSFHNLEASSASLDLINAEARAK